MSDTLRLTVTQDHLDLLGRMYVGWQNCEFGAPQIDPKHPYGNSDVTTDMAEILGIDFDEDEGLDRDEEERLTALHREMQHVLQILVRHLSIYLGDYERSNTYSADWRRAL